jgi:hypothetical protein
MGEIFLSRYDTFTHPDLSKRLKTHLTTNLSASEIEQFYGNRIRSRLRESFCDSCRVSSHQLNKKTNQKLAITKRKFNQEKIAVEK